MKYNVGQETKINITTLEKEYTGYVTNVASTAKDGRFKVTIEFENGKNINVYLEVTDISESIDKNEKEKIEAKLAENQKIGMYLDINLFKKVDGQDATKVTKTKQPVKVTFDLPENLINTDTNKTRKITIFKLHDGVATEIEVEVNGTTGTFETDEFSTYALTYTDEEVKTAETMAEETATEGTATDTSSSNPKTGDNIVLWISLAVVSIVGIVGTVKFIMK